MYPQLCPCVIGGDLAWWWRRVWRFSLFWYESRPTWIKRPGHHLLFSFIFCPSDVSSEVEGKEHCYCLQSCIHIHLVYFSFLSFLYLSGSHRDFFMSYQQRPILKIRQRHSAHCAFFNSVMWWVSCTLAMLSLWTVRTKLAISLFIMLKNAVCLVLSFARWCNINRMAVWRTIQTKSCGRSTRTPDTALYRVFN
jgi:hypothetical protein